MQDYEVHEESRIAQVTAVVRSTLAVEEIGPWLKNSYGDIDRVLSERQAGPTGPPFARYRMLGGGRFEIEAGFPATSPIDPVGDVGPSELPGGQVAVTVHVGPYDAMEPAYKALETWVNEHGGKVGDPWEVYFSDPSTDPAGWRTEIVQPFRPAEPELPTGDSR
ncbi:GyrI-like domain-containing protein [Gordonia sp. GONU]|uniref:GyrI-like domain-containing protein n=1 Tax=Gordonia sp. GONU TaxID=2972949 RepID=UPI0021ACE6E7|nr:GyrI-like domain-containing protein [Gordonia sp. GONU]MCR8897506.1 GyrI-like domain-containing protein [Gordonia sp. GONU]